jgi:hypothetical protein
MRNNLIAYNSVGAFEFGASENSIGSLFPEKFKQRVNVKGEKTIYFENLNFVFSPDDRLLEITVFPEAQLFINGSDIFKEQDVHQFLSLIDESPLEYVGLIFYPKLGLSVGGTELGADFAVTAISKGRFDSILPKFKSWHGVVASGRPNKGT